MRHYLGLTISDSKVQSKLRLGAMLYREAGSSSGRGNF
jgi:hypothetical protein